MSSEIAQSLTQAFVRPVGKSSKPRYIPAKGDLAYMNLDPQIGHEQYGRRPVVVVSNTSFNKMTGFASICPITNTVR